MELQIDQNSEEELVEASRSGDRDAYAALVRLFRARNELRKLLGGQEENK